MREQDIERYLTELGQELHHLGVRQSVRLLVIGGTFMLAQVGNRSITEDIDVVFKDVTDRKNSPLYQATLQAVKVVSNKNNLRDDWLNDGFSHTLRTMGGVPEGNLWRTYGMLEVFFPPEGYILALKLLGYRDKDKEDIEALCQRLQIQTRQQAQALVSQHIPNQAAQDVFGLEQTLDELF